MLNNRCDKYYPGIVAVIPRAAVRSCMLAFAALVLSSCAATLRLPAGAAMEVDDRLYFGRSIAGGGLVSDAEWDRFVGDVIVARFPDGHTAWHAEGAWRNSTGAVIREASMVLELVHPDDTASDAAIEGIIDAYKTRFHQESVLWVRSAAAVRF